MRGFRFTQIILPHNICLILFFVFSLYGYFHAISTEAAETGITKASPIGPYPSSVSANDLDISFTAADTVNNNTFAITGREFLIIRLAAAAADTASVTLDSQPDSLNRENDIVGYVLSPGDVAVFKFSKKVGWANSSGNVLISSSSSGIEMAVIPW